MKIRHFSAIKPKPVRYPEHLWQKYKNELLERCRRNGAKETAQWLALFDPVFKPSVHQINTRIAKWRRDEPTISGASDLSDRSYAAEFQMLSADNPGDIQEAAELQAASALQSLADIGVDHPDMLMGEESNLSNVASLESADLVWTYPVSAQGSLQPALDFSTRPNTQQITFDVCMQSRQPIPSPPTWVLETLSISRQVSKLDNFSRVVSTLCSLLPPSPDLGAARTQDIESPVSIYQRQILAVFDREDLSALNSLDISRLHTVVDIVSGFHRFDDIICMSMFLWCISEAGSSERRRNTLRCRFACNPNYNVMPAGLGRVFEKMVNYSLDPHVPTARYVLLMMKIEYLLSTPGRRQQGLLELTSLITLREELRADPDVMFSCRLHTEIAWYERKASRDLLIRLVYLGHCRLNDIKYDRIHDEDEWVYILDTLEDDLDESSWCSSFRRRYRDIAPIMRQTLCGIGEAILDTMTHQDDAERREIDKDWSMRNMHHYDESVRSRYCADYVSLYCLMLAHVSMILQGSSYYSPISFLGKGLPQLLHCLACEVTDGLRDTRNHAGFCERLQAYFSEANLGQSQAAMDFEKNLSANMRDSSNGITADFFITVEKELKRVLTGELLDLLSSNT